MDLVLEMFANVNLGKDLKVLSPGGAIVVIGSRGTVEIDPRDAMSREADDLGVLIFNASAEDFRSLHAALGAGLETGTLKAVLGEELPPSEAAGAHKSVPAEPEHGETTFVP